MKQSTEITNAPATERRVEDLLRRLTLKEKVSLLSGKDVWNTVPIERLGIPSVTMTDGPHGVRSNRPEAGRIVGPATSFPTGVSMASSWNPELIERVGEALGKETRAMGCDILLGPCVNIVRTPLAGRNFESYSEDPYLAGRIGVAWVKGVQSCNVGTSLKHYACNNQETERFRGDSQVDERTLREIYLPAFETIVKEARPWTVMCAYNRINGVYASEHNYLQNDILKGDWGFDGVVVSDWRANHTIVGSVKGGLDIEMPGPAKYYGDLLVAAVRNWQIDESAVDEAARRILRMIVRSGKLDDPSGPPPGAVNTPEHQALARELAEESIVLLKNENQLLPLSKKEMTSVAIVGPNAAECRIGGGGSSYLEPPYRISPLEGLRARLGDTVDIGYEKGCDNHIQPPILTPERVVPAKGEGNGLWGEYFNNPELSGKPVMEMVEPKLEHHWFLSPEGITENKFSVRWSGKLTALDTGRYLLQLVTTGIGRVYLDGELLFETTPEQTFLDRPVKVASTHVELDGERAYDLRVEYVELAQRDFKLVSLAFAAAPRPEDDDWFERAVELAKRSDVAVIFAGMPQGFESEGRDRPHMDLPGRQVELIKAVAAANPKTVVVLNCGAPVAMDWINDVPAVVEAFYPGQEGGNALANVLLGEVNPSGKLSVSFPKRYEDNPTFINYPGTREVRYGENIFVGYRYYDMKDIEPLFPFGFGLSYTTFEYSDIQVDELVKSGEPVNVSIMVKNTGDRAGKEVVQLYVHDRESALVRPPKELKGFKKVFLEPGESRKVDFVLDQRALSFYDPYQKRWVAEPGEFEVLIGSSSRDIRARAPFTLL